MQHTRRLVFRGNAAAASGRILRPTDVLIDVNGASSLTVVGGISQSRIEAQTFGPYVRFARASTLAEGTFHDAQKALDLTYRRTDQDGMTATTRVSAEVDGLFIGGKPEFSVARVRAALSGQHTYGADEPPFTLPDGGVGVDGVTIGGHGVAVDIDFDAFRQCPTHGSLLKAAGDRGFVAQHGGCFFLAPGTSAQAASGPSGMRESSGTIFGTIVKTIRWLDAPYPGATIDHHALTVPDFGTIFFGEILISSLSRRLTMLRLELGSPVGGFIACCDVESNGIWSP
jgi:hypothetical protein